MIWANLIGSLTLAGICAAQEPPPAPPAARPKVTVGRPAPKQSKDADQQTPPAPKPSPGDDQKKPPSPKDKAAGEAPVRTVRGEAVPGGKQGESVSSRYVDGLVIPKARPREDPTPSYRVSIRLLGGRRFTGVVVRDPLFHHTVFEGQHHKPATYRSSRSFKLSFVDGLDGEVELRWNQMAKVEVRDVVSDQEVLDMQRASELARMERERKTRAQRGVADPAAEGADTPEAEAGTGEEAPPEQEDEARPEILQRFPPEDGWSAERKRQIEWRRTVVGTFPTEEEQAFLDAFDEWEPAAKAWTAEQVQRMEAQRQQLERKKKQVEELKKQVLRDGSGRPASGDARPAGDG